jgi:hypothetical protein
MAADDTQLSTSQRKAIAALLTARDISSAADLAGVGRRTLYRWLKQPAFRRELHEAEQAAITAAAGRLAGMQAEALDALEDIFKRADDQDSLNLADLFTEGKYTDPKTEKTITTLILDMEKVRESGRLVKKVKLSSSGLEVDAYDALTANGQKLQAAKLVLDYLMRLREFDDLEARIKALEDKS